MMLVVRLCVMAAVLALSDSTLIGSTRLCFSSSTLARMKAHPLGSGVGTMARLRSGVFIRHSSLPNALRGGGRRSPFLRASSSSSIMSSAQPQKFFAFEGIIGAGKSTLLAELEAGGVKVVPEPLERWQETGIFQAFYGNMTRWSYTFQMQAFISRVKSIEQAFEQNEDIQDFVGERSWFADSFVFEPLLHRDGHISDIEHEAYREWWEWMQPKIPPTSGIIYLRASPETCLERIKKRSRAEESNIPLSYLQGLYLQHEEFKSDPQRLKNMLQAVREFCADPLLYAEKEAEEARRVEEEGGGGVQGSVDTAGWQAFKSNESAARN